MGSDWITWAWVAAAVALVVAEFLTPGLVTIFFGVGALAVAGLHALGIVTSLPAMLGTWVTTSVVCTLALRPTLVRYFPSDRSRTPHRPELEAFGQEVEVLEDVDESGTEGRIRYQGTTWKATCVHGHIPRGGRARLVTCDDLVWTVERVEDLPPHGGG